MGFGAQAQGEVFIVEEADDPGFSSEDLPPAVTPVLQLVEGFNLVSWNVDPPDDAIATLVAPIAANLIQVLGFENIAVNPNPGGGVGAKLYDPLLPGISTLATTDHQLGYWFKMSAPDELTIEGAAIDHTANRALDTGWNLVSYLPGDNDLTGHAVASTAGSLVKVLGFETALNNPNSPGLGGKLYDPNLPDFINTLSVMAPELGYWIYVSGDVGLDYPATADPATPPASKVVAAAAADEHVQPTSQWMGIYGQLIADGESAPAGTVVDVVDADGNTAAWFEVHREGAYGYLPIYLDDPATAQDEGADVGEWLTVRVDGQPTDYRVEWTEFGDLVQLDLEVKSAAARGLPQVFALQQNYPNPFNPATTISYQLPRDEAVSLSIYNPGGQRIRQLVRDVQQAGVHSVLWDGRDDAQIPVASGYYFYRLEAGDFQQTHKLLLLK